MILQLQSLKGNAFWQQLERITKRSEFRHVEGSIYSAAGDRSQDLENLLDAARKAVLYGYTVFILPNPRGIRTADFIFVRKGIFRLYELKTIYGSNSVSNRLREASSQSSRVLLNMKVKYNPRKLAKEIHDHFNDDDSALEVLVFMRGRHVQVRRPTIPKQRRWEYILKQLK